MDKPVVIEAHDQLANIAFNQLGGMETGSEAWDSLVSTIQKRVGYILNQPNPKKRYGTNFILQVFFTPWKNGPSSATFKFFWTPGLEFNKNEVFMITGIEYKGP